MNKQTLANTITELQLNNYNQVYKDVCTAIIYYLSSYNDDDNIDISKLYLDLANTQGGSWLVYNSDIIQYFDRNKDDIDTILFCDNDTIATELQLNTCQSVLEIIQRLVFAAYERTLSRVLFEL